MTPLYYYKYVHRMLLVGLSKVEHRIQHVSCPILNQFVFGKSIHFVKKNGHSIQPLHSPDRMSILHTAQCN